MPDIESLLEEKRVFQPSAAFARRANWSRKRDAVNMIATTRPPA